LEEDDPLDFDGVSFGASLGCALDEPATQAQWTAMVNSPDNSKKTARQSLFVGRFVLLCAR